VTGIVERLRNGALLPAEALSNAEGQIFGEEVREKAVASNGSWILFYMG
jgi:hypothetical protein